MNHVEATLSLVFPNKLWRRSEVLGSSALVPKSPGIYAWYFKDIPGSMDAGACHQVGQAKLLYVGIAPRAPAANGNLSKRTLQDRIKYHFDGNASGSTLRMTLGCLLSSKLGITFQPIGSRSFSFGEGEALLDEWMAENALVCWAETDVPWLLEEMLFRQLDLPLNIKGNSHNAFHPQLTQLRKAMRAKAKLHVVDPH